MLTNQAGATVATYTYDSYGKTLTTTGKAKNPLLFAGSIRTPSRVCTTCGPATTTQARGSS